MPFDLHITVSESSPAGQVLQRLIIAEHVTPEQAVTRILNDVAKQQGKNVPADDLSELDEAMSQVRAEHPTYASFFGAVERRPGAHESKEAVDRYIADLCNDW